MANELGLGVLFYGKLDASLNAQIKKLEQAVLGLNKGFTTVNKGMSTVEKTSKSATVATTAQTKVTKKAGDEMGMYGRKIGQVQGGIQRLTAAMKVTASYTLAAAALFGVVNAFKQGISAIFDFDQALKNLQAITSATDAEIIVLEKVIKEVASTTKYSAQEVSDAAILIGQAGFTAAESIDAIQAVAMLATGTLSDMKTTADLVTTAVRAFGLEASDSGRIADIFASAVNRSKLTIDKIRTSFNYLGPIAHKAGLSLEETAAGMMVLANAGLRASTIGTGFRQVLARLIAPSDKLRTAFIAAGADLSKMNPAMNDMETIIGELVKVVPNAQKAFELFGLRGAAAVSALTEAGVGGFREMLKEVYRVGTATEMANKQMEGLGVMAKNLMDKIGLLAVALGEGGIADAFRLLLKLLRPFVDLLTQMADNVFGRVIVAATSLTVVLLALKVTLNYLAIQLSAIAFGYTVVAVKTMVAATGSGVFLVATTALRTALQSLWVTMLANPYIAIAAGIALVVIGITTWLNKLSEAATIIEANNIAIDKHIQSLESYKQQLSEVEKGSIKYTSIIQRLIKDYPELASQVNLATMEFRDEGKALDSLIAKKHDEKIKGLIQLYDEYGKKVKNIVFWNLLWNDTIGKLSPAALPKEIEADLNRQAQIIRQLAIEFKQYGIVSGSTLKDISAALTKHGDVAEDALDKKAKALKKYLDETAKASLKSSDIIKQLSDGWVELYNKTDDARKKDVIEAWKAYNKKEAVLIKEAIAYSEAADDKKSADEKYQIESEKLYEDSIKKAAKRADVKIDIKKRTTEKELELIDSFIEQENNKYINSLFNISKLNAEELKNFKGTKEERERLSIELDGKERKLDQDRLNNIITLENRRIELAKQVYKDQIKNVEEYYSLVKNIAETSHNEIVDLLDTRLKRELNKIELQNLSEQGIIHAKARVQEEYYKDTEEESKRHFNELTKITNETYDAIAIKIRASGESAEKQEKELFDAKKQRNDDIKKLYQERSDAYKKTIDFLISEEARLTGAIKSAREEREQIAQKGEDLIRNLKYKLLTDEQKWNEERQRANELMAQANAELLAGNTAEATKFAEEARSIYDGLAGEVKDKSGNVIKTVGDTVKIAIDGVTKATELLTQISSKGIISLETELVRVQSQLNTVNNAFEGFKQTIQAFNKQAKLELDVSPVIQALQKAEAAVKSYIAALKKIPAKIVTQFVGKASPEKPITETIDDVESKLEGMSDYANSLNPKVTTTFDAETSLLDAAFDNATKKIGVYLEQMASLQVSTTDFPGEMAVFRQLRVDMMTSISKKIKQTADQFSAFKTLLGETFSSYGSILTKQTGGIIPGSGPGDTVPAMLEPGEFVEPKSTVKKYGSDFFEALRNKLIPKDSIQSLMAGVKMQTGGIIKSTPQRMQSEGMVQSLLPESRASNVFNIKIAPTIMSGDRTTIRKVAVEIKAALQGLDHRWA